jgi:hypothetical protein
MTKALFLRLLEVSIDEKEEALASAIVLASHHTSKLESFMVEPQDFRQIPGSPFAYWTSQKIRRLFLEVAPLESEERVARLGDHPDDHSRYLRLFYEAPLSQRSPTRRWVPYQKGGIYSRYYADIHLLVDWDMERNTYHGFSGRPGRSSMHPSNYEFYFRPGLTWPRRTQKGLNLRVLPAGCIFADKGPAVFVQDNDEAGLLALLGVMNTTLFKALVELQMAFGSYEVGVIQRTPVPTDFSALDTALVLEAHDLVREADTIDETTHAFHLPGLALGKDGSLLATSWKLEDQARDRAMRLSSIQIELDAAVFDLYELDASDVGLESTTDSIVSTGGEDEGDEDETVLPEDLSDRVQNLLIWCVGVAFGRWDARFALKSDLLPALQGPFDPLPRCAPGALVGPDGLPANRENIASEAWLGARKNVLDVPDLLSPLANRQSSFVNQPTITPAEYPIRIAWDGILVDDPTHPADLVNRVRQVLALLWGERAGAIEKEACEILGYRRLRDYFRDPRKGFFAFHIKRYSKSRRKAPIYWLLQSENRNYAIWLYYHRMDDSTYFTAARDYADTKVNLETDRLDELRQGLAALQGSALKRRERDIERQQKLAAEVTNFRDKLDEIALRGLPPDHNDGVIISIAPLWELAPWKEAEKMWNELAAGRHGWSTMAKQMRERGLTSDE